LSRLDVLKGLESTLENFLARAVEAEEERVEAFRSIDKLDGIARDSMRGRLVSAQLGNWFAHNKNRLQGDSFSTSEVTSIANLLSDIKSGLDDSDPESHKLAGEIERWRSKGVVPKRKLVLKLKPRSAERDLLGQLTGYLSRGVEHLESGEFEGRHLLTILDDVLKSAAAKEDKMYIHLAGAMIYFMKMNGYKIGPFVRRLREIEQERFGHIDAE
jgi:hypothetical protein